MLYDTLKPVIEDAWSNPTSAAYDTFFKDVSYEEQVLDVLIGIAFGEARQLDGDFIASQGLKDSTSPRLMCSTAPGQMVFTHTDRPPVDVYEYCQERPQHPSFYLSFFREIILCPHFFTTPIVALRSTCLTVNRYQGNFYQDGSLMTRYQLWSLMHELAHFYIQQTRPIDVYNVNDCLRLSAGRSVVNAQNFVYYAASKSHPQQIEDRSHIISDSRDITSRHQMEMFELSKSKTTWLEPSVWTRLRVAWSQSKRDSRGDDDHR
ncbi:hypothetical protein ACLMJK_007149 [Lecanora helva]